MEGKKKRKQNSKTRIDAKINKAKVVKSVLANPMKTQTQIAKETGLGVTTVQEHIKALKSTKDDRIMGICQTDIENVSLGQNELNRRLQEQADKLKVSEIVDIIQEGTKRYTMFSGELTDEKGGMKIQITEEQRMKLLERLKLDE